MRITAAPVRLIPLAVLAAVTSPTAIAVVLVILNRPCAVRLLVAYLVGSFLASLLIGIAIVAALTVDGRVRAAPRRVGAAVGDDPRCRHSAQRGLVAVRAFSRHASPGGGATRTRKPKRNTSNDANPKRSSQIPREGSVGLIAALGVAMHLPRLLYLAGLADIAHAQVRTYRALLLLVLFNLIMLAPIALPLLGRIAAPQATEQTTYEVSRGLQAHASRPPQTRTGASPFRPYGLLSDL